MKHPSDFVLDTVADIPATMLVLATCAERHGAKDGEAVVKGLVSERRLKMIGERKNARYALPGYRRSKRK